jgi:diguanylate cyclase (GGDEF)-like protein
MATIGMLYLPVVAAGYRPSLAALLGVLAPSVAALAWLHAGSRVSGRARLAFWSLSCAAGFGALSQLSLGYEATFMSGSGGVPGIHGLLAGSLGMWVLIMFGAGLTVRPVRDVAPAPALLADTFLVLLVGLVVGSRVVLEPAEAGAHGMAWALVVAQRGTVVIAVVVASLVVLRRGSALPSRPAASLLVGILLLATWSVVCIPLRLPTAGMGGGLAVWLLGWLLLALSAGHAPTMGTSPRGVLQGPGAGDRVPEFLVPAVALFLAAAILDLGLRADPRPGTVVAAASLGVALALRTVQSTRMTERAAEQRRRLAHTQALVGVTHALAGTTDLDATLQVISESARSVFGTKGAGIELMTEDGRSLETRAAVGMPEAMMGMRFPVEGSFTGWVVRHGEPRATLDPSRDPYIQPQSLELLGRWAVAAAPIRFRGETLGALFACIRVDAFDREELALLQALAEQAAMAIHNARLFEQVTILSVTDPLTGLANRRQLERELAREFAAAQRGRLLTAVIFDLDAFKSYNDSYGHLAGDEALQIFAVVLRTEIRAMNLVARYGGDEFVALLSETDPPGAAVFIERVRRRFAREILAIGRQEISISAGVAGYSPEIDTSEELLRKADEDLYRTKPRART